MSHTPNLCYKFAVDDLDLTPSVKWHVDQYLCPSPLAYSVTTGVSQPSTWMSQMETMIHGCTQDIALRIYEW